MNELPLSRRELGERTARRLDAEAASVRGNFLLEDATDRQKIERRHAAEIARLRASRSPAWMISETRRQHATEIADLPTLDAERGRRLGKTVSVKGRVTTTGKTVWDIYQVQGKKLRLVQSGIPDAGEAVAIANDLVLGRVRVSFGGVRRCFETTGSFLAPSTAIDAAGSYRGKARPIRVSDTHLIITDQ